MTQTLTRRSHPSSKILVDLVLLGIVVVTFSGCEHPSTGSETAGASRTTAAVGDTVSTEKFDISVKSAASGSRIDGGFLNSKAADGAIYIALQWSYKNITSKPISGLSSPSIHLVSPDGTTYDADLQASAAYASTLELNSKVLSDLNPGIRATDADVFEVSKNLFDEATWKILVDADSPVEFRFAAKAPKPSVAAAPTPPAAAQAAAPPEPKPAPDSAPSPPTPAVASTSAASNDGPATVATNAATSAPSFDCTKAESPVEKMICSDTELAQTDADFAGFYKRNLAVAGNFVPEIKRQEKIFLKSRDACTVRDCVTEAYRARWEELAQMGFVKE